MSERTSQWDVECDVVVVGSGAAALSAAVTAAVDGAKILILEKESVLGGTTGVSGGAIWIPNNRHLAPAGLQDSREDAVSYIRHIAGGRVVDPNLIDVFVDTAPQMLDFLESVTPLETQSVTNLHDYYEAIRERVPGCKDFSRSSNRYPSGRRGTRGVVRAVGNPQQSVVTRSRHHSEGGRGCSGPRWGAGNARGCCRTGTARHPSEGCCARGRSAQDASRSRRASPAADSGTASRRGRARCGDRHPGIVAGRALEHSCVRGVVLACGGFEWDRDMMRAHIGYDVQPLSPGGNVGDGHRMAMRAGAQLAQMNHYWGQAPVSTRRSSVRTESRSPR